MKGAWQGRRAALPLAFAAAGALLAPAALPEEAPQAGRAASSVAGAFVAAALVLLAASPRRTVSRIGAWGAFLCLGLLLGAAAFRLAEALAPLFDGGRLQAMLEQNRSAALWIYAAVCFLQPIALPLPEALTVMAGSAVLGAFPAFVAGFAGTMLGVLAMFALARYGGMKVAVKLVKPQQLERYHRFVSRHEWPILVALFVIPVLPDEIVCVGAGISGVAIRRFLTVAVLSKLATSSSFAYSVELGDLLSVSPAQLLLAVGSVAFAAVFLPRIARLLRSARSGGSAPSESRPREGNGEPADGETPQTGL
ncbi:MAG: hypothetical protein BAA02_02560 [Paenibacillaceae bacterium ZCTH02-B3]|nr:MAG: hypothetical protein BAA02_02560 [Paenibacillaceae bacterium ZCTH02-B3]